MALWPKNITLDLNPSQEKLNDTTTGLQMGICSTLYVLAIVFAGPRLYVRTVMTKSFGRDDVFLIIALCLLTAGFTLMCVQAANGLGRHIDLIPLDQAQTFRMVGWFMTLCVANLGMSALKTAIGFNVLRFCSDELIWPWYKYLVWGVLGIVWAYTCIFFGVTWQHCRPFPRFWNLTITEGYCVTPPVYAQWGLSNSACNIVTDVLFAILPVPIIWRILLSTRVRLYLIGVLSLGYVSVALGVVKVTYQLAFVGQRNKTYHLNVPFWAFLQLSAGIVTASCVALRPLLNKVLHINDSRVYAISDLTPSGGVSHGSRTDKSQKGFAHIELDEHDDVRNRSQQRLDLFDFNNGDNTLRHHNTSLSIPSNDESFYHHTSGESGSEDVIISSHGGRKGLGITKTTSFSVSHAV